MRALAEVIGEWAAVAPEGLAFAAGSARMTWRQYAERSDRVAVLFAALGLEPGECVAVLLPDGPGVHTAYVATEKAGLVAVGIGPRAGLQELEHLLRTSEASALISPALHRGEDLAAWLRDARARGLAVRHHVVVEGELGERDCVRIDGADHPLPPVAAGADARRMRSRGLCATDVFLLNSTSGTTGMPKCVIHDQARWNAFHELALEAGELTRSDRFLSALPAPFGFGIWTAHVTPTLLGAPTVVMPGFSPEATLAAIEEHEVTVLAAVSTQFIMLLGSPELERRDLSSLRVLFTGGEAVPSERALEFEKRTGAAVLQFYGSNETGALSRTTTRDPRERRLHTAGRVIESMNVRLFDEGGSEVSTPGRGQPGCRGPLLSRGYHRDPEANARLWTSDGWMLTGDVVEVDANGTLTVIGRTADFIIRGGKNVSAAAVEAAVASHPHVAVCAAVGMPDPVFGERVCVYAELTQTADLALDQLVAHLRANDVSVENLPERLIVLDALPRSSGGKIAKSRLREDIRRRIATDADKD